MEIKPFIYISGISFSEPYSTSSIEIREVECPDCGHRFTQKIEGGCFGSRATPYDCPKCDYPTRVIFAKQTSEVTPI